MAVESRTGEKRPQLSDLRESGAIEQDADMVLALVLEYYGLKETTSGETTANLAEVLILKHRHGSTGTVQLLSLVNHQFSRIGSNTCTRYASTSLSW